MILGKIIPCDYIPPEPGRIVSENAVISAMTVFVSDINKWLYVTGFRITLPNVTSALRLEAFLQFKLKLFRYRIDFALAKHHMFLQCNSSTCVINLISFSSYGALLLDLAHT